MGKHCYHPGRKVLARRRRLKFLMWDTLLYALVLVGLIAVVLSMNILLGRGM